MCLLAKGDTCRGHTCLVVIKKAAPAETGQTIRVQSRLRNTSLATKSVVFFQELAEEGRTGDRVNPKNPQVAFIDRTKTCEMGGLNASGT